MGKNNINLDLHIRGLVFDMIFLYLALKVNKGPTFKSV